MIQAGSLEEINLEKACLTIGSFDGLHRGHQKLIAALVDSANQQNAPAVVLTFFPHPAVILKHIESPYYLSTPDEKADQLAKLGVDILITIPFTLQLAEITAEDFIAKLIKHTGFKHLVVGCGFVLGKGRQGTVDVLTAIGRLKDYTVTCISPEENDSEIISSSKIRGLLETGDVTAASSLLGRNYSITGKVVSGDGRGRTIGFPTANLQTWPQKLLPAPGVYRCITEFQDKTYLSVGNIGFRPTFTNNTRQVFVELHLLDFNENLYGQELKVQFTHRLRGETRYPSFEELVRQINRDIEAARKL